MCFCNNTLLWQYLDLNQNCKNARYFGVIETLSNTMDLSILFDSSCDNTCDKCFEMAVFGFVLENCRCRFCNEVSDFTANSTYCPYSMRLSILTIQAVDTDWCRDRVCAYPFPEQNSKILSNGCRCKNWSIHPNKTRNCEALIPWNVTTFILKCLNWKYWEEMVWRSERVV